MLNVRFTQGLLTYVGPYEILSSKCIFLTFYAIFTFRQRVQHYFFLVIHLAFIRYVVQRHESTVFQLTLCRMNLYYNISPDVKESF